MHTNLDMNPISLYNRRVQCKRQWSLPFVCLFIFTI